jgi:hypothetical protein
MASLLITSHASLVPGYAAGIRTMTRMLALLIALAACGGSKDQSYPEAKIIDLSTSTAELQRDFDAHASEPRFVTIVAPT